MVGSTPTLPLECDTRELSFGVVPPKQMTATNISALQYSQYRFTQMEAALQLVV